MASINTFEHAFICGEKALQDYSKVTFTNQLVCIYSISILDSLKYSTSILKILKIEVFRISFQKL